MLRETLETFHFTRYCGRCAAYVPFFLSARGSQCALCDARLVLSGLADQMTVIGSLPKASSSPGWTAARARMALHSQR
jgi:hypothetical protein